MRPLGDMQAVPHPLCMRSPSSADLAVCDIRRNDLGRIAPRRAARPAAPAVSNTTRSLACIETGQGAVTFPPATSAATPAGSRLSGSP